ncbi:hypothetical protein GCM10007352_15440 [Mucilaginibacter phyllosphaerae]|uniref:Uncharacterized protein n=1 Tax=Mucilaginibacter phyllosphaerae TaxID=1812349 RepID=A0ABR6IBA8_9SPHI|nr:hypothetical protein [Mucilaginibacter phyllosphaerae]GGH09876.1 hypothetical protein GCM10007352_15440 [Mucilaginibacter phyllosphaerae]
MFRRLYLVFELVALLTVLFCFDKIKKTAYKYFAPYLAFVLIYEVGSIENWFVIDHKNLWISNITLDIFFVFYSVFLTQLIRSIKFKGWIKYIIILSILFSIINTIFIQGFWELNTITILIQFVILIALACFYFYELMLQPNYVFNIASGPGFWMSTGVLFFCLTEFLFYSAFAYMAYEKNYTHYDIVQLVLSNIANAILYSCLTISFLCIQKMKC